MRGRNDRYNILCGYSDREDVLFCFIILFFFEFLMNMGFLYIIMMDEKIDRGFSVVKSSIGSPTDGTSPIMFGQRNFDHLIFFATDAQRKFSLNDDNEFEIGKK